MTKARSTTPRMVVHDGVASESKYAATSTSPAAGQRPNVLFGSQATVPGASTHLTAYGPPSYIPGGTPTTAASPLAPELAGTWESRSGGGSTTGSAFGCSSSVSAAGGAVGPSAGGAFGCLVARPHACVEPGLPGARALHSSQDLGAVPEACERGSSFASSEGGAALLRADAARMWRDQAAGSRLSSDGPPPPGDRISSESGVTIRAASPSPHRVSTGSLTPPELSRPSGLGLPSGLAPATAPQELALDDIGRLGGLLARAASGPALLGGSAQDSEFGEATAATRRPWPRGPSRSQVQRSETGGGTYSVSSSLDALRAKVDAIESESRRLKSGVDFGGKSCGGISEKAPAPFFAFGASPYVRYSVHEGF